MGQTIPAPSEGDVQVAKIAFSNILGRSGIDPETPGLDKFEASFVGVHAQKQAEIRWLNNMLHDMDTNANGEQPAS